MSADPLAIDPQFIEENSRSQLVSTRQGGPYSRGQRRKRRKEVFRLHFEQGLPATKIAELMHVNRNTINDDIRFLYRKLAGDLEGQDFDGYFSKQLVRLEIQRSRIMGYLSQTQDLDKKLAIEKTVVRNRL